MFYQLFPVVPVVDATISNQWDVFSKNSHLLPVVKSPGVAISYCCINAINKSNMTLTQNIGISLLRIFLPTDLFYTSASSV